MIYAIIFIAFWLLIDNADVLMPLNTVGPSSTISTNGSEGRHIFIFAPRIMPFIICLWESIKIILTPVCRLILVVTGW